MAEILLSLTIIGVVAAITLPSLTGNINERTWNTQRKALYARMSQAISLMPSLNGYGKLRGTFDEDGSQTVTEDTAAETFVTEGLSKVFKINNICDSEHLADCGIPTKITQLVGGEVVSFPKDASSLNDKLIYASMTVTSPFRRLNSKVAAFETANGESIAVFYNPSCPYSNTAADNGRWNYRYFEDWYCANFIYDLNGKKGPNTMNKDIGVITVYFATDSLVVAPVPSSKVVTDNESATFPKVCTKIGDDYRIPNVYETISMYINKNLFNLDFSSGIMTSTSVYNPTTNSKTYWAHHPGSGDILYTQTLWRGDTICVRRN